MTQCAKEVARVVQRLEEESHVWCAKWLAEVALHDSVYSLGFIRRRAKTPPSTLFRLLVGEQEMLSDIV